MTSDGMLSCYTPFLIAIVGCRASADSATIEPTSRETSTPPPNSLHGSNEKKDDGAASSASCPPQLCAEALWALSEYAVLSPGLAVKQVLPLAEELARNTLECPQVTAARCSNESDIIRLKTCDTNSVLFFQKRAGTLKRHWGQAFKTRKAKNSLWYGDNLPDGVDDARANHIVNQDNNIFEHHQLSRCDMLWS